MTYLFKDTDIAAKRLGLVAQAFDAPTRAFVRDHGPAQPDAVFDLGCGPGYTTRLLVDFYPQARVVGLDSSPHYVALAKGEAEGRAVFHVHDVTSTPFPVAPAGLIFCRFLLSHLHEPEKALRIWSSQLARGGYLMVDEVESITSDDPTLTAYLDLVAAMMRSDGRELYVGPRLEAWVPPDGVTKRLGRVYAYVVAAQLAASMFVLNLSTWRDHAFVRENYAQSYLDELSSQLQALADGAEPEARIEWGLRQMVFARTRSRGHTEPWRQGRF